MCALLHRVFKTARGSLGLWVLLVSTSSIIAAVLDVSFSVFLMTLEISGAKRMGRDDDFCDVARIRIREMSRKCLDFQCPKFTMQLCRGSKFLLILVLSAFVGSTYV